jgi:glycosyltransferase involved in cell wall biosynthesis
MTFDAKKPVLSVVVPCFNEEKSLDAIVGRFFESEPEKNGYQLVLVDNGSTDGTAEKLARLVRANAFVKLVRVAKNRGYGFGIAAGLKEADGDFVGWTHADLQCDVLDAVRAYLMACESEDPMRCFAKGRRMNRPAIDSFLTFGMSMFAAVALGKWMDDINAQPNVFHRDFLGKLRDAPDDFAFDLYAYCKALECRMPMLRFPVDFSRRAHGKSHWNMGIMDKWKFIKRTAVFTLEMRSLIKGGKHAENNP